MCILWFHNWGKWEVFEENWFHLINDKKYPYVQKFQRRICMRCGKYQQEEI
jgi:hypothetical protein